MPSSTFMVVDPRCDHSMRIPRPDLSLSLTLAVPNACTLCHRVQNYQWAEDAFKRCYGKDRKRGHQRYARVLTAALLEIYVANSTARSEKANGAERRQDWILCRLRDNGPGIEPRYQERVFGLFERLDVEISGIGVGLALVKQIVELHNAKVWIDSQGDGQGSCFCFTLPVQIGT